MEQAFSENRRVPVTVVKAGPCVVVQVKDGAVQLGFGEKKMKKVTKPMRGHLKGAVKGEMAPRWLCEVPLSEGEEHKKGDMINVSQIFSEGDIVSVTGVSKGKGFAGGMKRWGFAGGPRTHGQSDRQRAPGSIGQGTNPGRVRKGKKMAGRMGGERVMVRNLKVMAVDETKNELVLAGPVPGAKGGLLMITKTKKK